MKLVGIQDLAREVGVKNNMMFDALAKMGAKASELRSSTPETTTAEKLRKHFRKQDAGEGIRLNSSALGGSQVEHPQSAAFRGRPKAMSPRQTLIEQGIITPSASATQEIIARPSPLNAKKSDRIGNRRTSQREKCKTPIQKSPRPDNAHRHPLQKSLIRPATWRLACNLHSIQSCATESKREFWKREDIEKLFGVSRQAAQNIMGAASKIESYEGVYALSRDTLLGFIENRILEGKTNRVSGIVLSSIERLSPGGLTIKIIPSMPSNATSEADAKIPCQHEQCTAEVFPYAMKLHIANCHPNQEILQLPNIASTRLSFVLLPPGAWGFKQVFEHYRKHSVSHPDGFFEQEFDWNRIKRIGTLNPKLTHFGAKSWFGYAVYEFSYSNRVVLECPIRGNATYILEGDWEKMIGHTKATLRYEYADQCTVVKHVGDWLGRISRALRVKR